VRHPLPGDLPLVSIVVPTRDKVDLLRKCVDSILERTTYAAYEIVIVDNQSKDPATLEYFASVDKHSHVHVLKHDCPFNYSHINNEAVRQCRGELVCLLNNDIEVITPDWLEELVSHALRPHVGAVGAMLYYPNDTIQHAGVVIGVHGVAAHPYSGMPRGHNGQMARARLTQALSAVTAACLLVRREVFEKVGGLDTALQVAFNDIDFCLRIRQCGYVNIWTPFAELYHHESASRGLEDTPEKHERFEGEIDFMIKRWSRQLRADPYYNPNLSLSDEPFALAFPPRDWVAVNAKPLSASIENVSVPWPQLVPLE
jgi:GT2 family glycosyltransferase